MGKEAFLTTSQKLLHFPDTRFPVSISFQKQFSDCVADSISSVAPLQKSLSSHFRAVFVVHVACPAYNKI